MKLSYRGLEYDYNPPAVVTASSDIADTYNSVDLRFRNQGKAPVQQATVDLKYRGIHYTTAAESQARNWTINREHRQENRQRSMLQRLRAEIIG